MSDLEFMFAGHGLPGRAGEIVTDPAISRCSFEDCPNPTRPRLGLVNLLDNVGSFDDTCL